MSLKSMTGFGDGRARGDGMVVAVELNSVNRKSFDVRIGLPPELRSFQAELQKLLSKGIARGAVVCNVEIEWSNRARENTVEIDRTLAKSYLQSIRKTAENLGIEDDLTASALLELPGVVQISAPEVDGDQMRTVLVRAAEKALKKLDGMKKREGTELQKDILGRLSLLQKNADKIRSQAPKAVENHREELAARIAAAGGEVGDERLQREVVMYADRADISEELTRLESHFKQARDMIKSGEPAGRGLDFLCQEMLREINTIASKSPDPDIAGLAIEFKSELERVREQVRNVE